MHPDCLKTLQTTANWSKKISKLQDDAYARMSAIQISSKTPQNEAFGVLEEKASTAATGLQSIVTEVVAVEKNLRERASEHGKHGAEIQIGKEHDDAIITRLGEFAKKIGEERTLLMREQGEMLARARHFTDVRQWMSNGVLPSAKQGEITKAYRDFRAAKQWEAATYVAAVAGGAATLPVDAAITATSFGARGFIENWRDEAALIAFEKSGDDSANSYAKSLSEQLLLLL